MSLEFMHGCLVFATTVNPLYNHAHFSHILVCVTFVFGNHLFLKERPCFRVTITLVNSIKYLQSFSFFFCKCDLQESFFNLRVKLSLRGKFRDFKDVEF
jgi:hypothetical protein